MESSDVNLDQDNSNNLITCRIESALNEKINSIDKEISWLEVEIIKKRYSLNYYQNIINKIKMDRKIMKKYIDELGDEINSLR
jgi:hypothetical protein